MTARGRHVYNSSQTSDLRIDDRQWDGVRGDKKDALYSHTCRPPITGNILSVGAVNPVGAFYFQ